MSYLWEQAGNFMMWLLTSLYSVTSSWGLAIILLTILVRCAMHPLTQKQMVSMQRMQKLQPRMKVLQEKYKDDKESMNREVMALYKENNVNPMSGCLPLLVQLPIFILLYNVLSRYGFPGATFLAVQLDGSVLTTIADAIHLVNEAGQTIPKEELGIVMIILSAASNPSLLFANILVWLPNTVLLIIIAFLTWYQQHLTSSGNPQMAMMGWFMPLFLTFICLSLPGGVLLYWGVSSLMGVVQQLRTVRKANIEMQEKPVLLKDKPVHKG
ncbi:protein translocase component YidC [Synergistales bacterium]|nr:protein translocase component YidC [Synergistales bacterium]